jgi:hypothetical protein
VRNLAERVPLRRENLKRVKTESTMLRTICVAGLPDGIFSYQKSQFLYILEGLGIERFGIFLAYLYLLLWPLDID